MQRIIIRFIDANTVIAPMLDSEAMLDVLEETLYIEQELEPVKRDWLRDFIYGNSTRFHYHNSEFVTVTYLGENIFEVREEKGNV